MMNPLRPLPTPLWRPISPLFSLFLLTGAITLANSPAWAEELEARPNILWITSEDNGLELGCYGHPLVRSPNIDALADRGLRYRHASSNAPVCAPARTTILTGLYAPSMGAGHMRSEVRLPESLATYPALLREAGYYCTNNNKEDYNFEDLGSVWDESNRNAHWRNRPEGAPFMAVFNFTTSHESRIRGRAEVESLDPAEVEVPAYHPDTPAVREDWAKYFESVMAMDREVGEIVRELEEDGLAEDTIIFYYGDHGSGMPRHKRWLYQGGLEVPMIVVVPERFRHLAPEGYEPGGLSERLVSFVDLAPTVLSLVGVAPPETMEGRAFMGVHEAPPREFTFGHRERMDERYDLSRSVFDGRYKYIRNYRPDRPQGQFLRTMFLTPTTQEWHRLWEAGELTPEQAAFFEPKPVEELYDTLADPHEVANLTESEEPGHVQALARLRAAHEEWMRETRDPALLAESEMLRRAEGSTVYEMKQDPALYDMEAVFAAARLASDVRLDDAETRDRLRGLLAAGDSGVRYWGALGLMLRGQEAVAGAEEGIAALLDDESPATAIAAAEAVLRFGTGDEHRNRAIDVLVAWSDVDAGNAVLATEALNALDLSDAATGEVLERLKDLPGDDERIGRRYRSYPGRLREKFGLD